MSLQMQPYSANGVRFDRQWLELILLEIADAFHIQIVWDRESALLTGLLAVAGGFLGGYTGGRVGAAIGAGVGGVAGFGMSQAIPLRQLWITLKEKLEELLYILFNYLRRLDAVDYINAVEILMSCATSRRELVKNIINFISHKLGREVLSSLNAA